MKSEIMTAYFNYLHQQGQAPKTDEDLRIKTKVVVFPASIYLYPEMTIL